MDNIISEVQVHSVKDTSVGLSLTNVIIAVKVVLKYDYSIWCFLSVVSESNAAQKVLWSGQFSHYG